MGVLILISYLFIDYVKTKKTYNKMSLFQKCRAYLLKNNIELNEEDYSPDGKLVISEETIIKWDFPLLKPSLEELNSKVDDKLLKQTEKQYKKKEKLKQVKSFQFPILDDDDLLNVIPYDGMIYINEKDGSLYYYYKGKLQKVRVFEGV